MPDHLLGRVRPHRGLQIVEHDALGDAPEVLKGLLIAGEKGPQPRLPRRERDGAPGVAQDKDKQLRRR